ncbi:MAG TPA: serine/threonine-protein kinase [Gemmatimonadaceae bacterium]|nr:serine/threonine-protein kinase [Gemmatimonadaceae bacterium]
MSAQVRICPQCGSEYTADIKFCPKDGSTLRVPPGAALIGSVIADRYHILKKLGEGGMGQVFLAEHVKMGRPSAIKIMSPGMMQDADAISRFNREAANASKIMHPNVAAIYDFGETSDGLIYLAMEYIEGESLTKVLERDGTLAPARAASIIRQTASALDAAHERGIVHRDLKPDNIMISRNRDGTDQVKVVDFGIAKAQGATGQKVTKTGMVVGTPEYMSPEQLAGDSVDGRSDTYALALVAFHLLTGDLPFAGGSAQETMIRRLTDKPRRLAEVRPSAEWPAPLERAIGRALERDASLRPATSSDFAAEFARSVEGMAVEADSATQVLSSVPATRVDSGQSGLQRRPSATRPSTAPSPVPAAKPKRGLLYTGVGVAVLAGALVVGMRAGEKKQEAIDSHTVQPLSKPIDSVASPDSTAATKALPVKDTTTPPTVTKSAPKPKPLPPPSPKPAPPPAPTPAPPAAPPPSPPSAPDNATHPLIVVPPNVRAGGPEERARTPQQAAMLARRAVDTAAAMVERGEQDRALFLLWKAIPYLQNHHDSMDAAYHASEALLMKADKENNPQPRTRACQILARMKQDPSGYLGSAVQALYDNGGCK